jgi:opacity protein-like surface antigen/outer membrane protein OmpA-like peptidoglycan-associated protein
LLFCAPLLAQDFVDVTVFGGGSFFHRKSFASSGGAGPLVMKIGNGGLIGIRVAENFWEYVGLEESFSYGVGNVRLLTSSAPFGNEASFRNRLWQFYINPVVYFTPRNSRIRPYVTAGLGLTDFEPLEKSKVLARRTPNPLFGAPVDLRRSVQPAFNYGGGVKVKVTDHVGVRLDARGFATKIPSFGLARVGAPTAIGIPRGNRALSNAQITAGIVFSFGTAPTLVSQAGGVAPPVEVHPFAGGSFFHRKHFAITGRPLPLFMKIGNGGVFGVRVTENFWEHIGIEESFSYGVGNVRLLNAPGAPSGNEVSFHNRLWQFYVNPVFHFTPRDSWLRPYITGGLGFTRYQPDDVSKTAARSTTNPLLGIPIALGNSTKVVGNYGGGIKMRLTDRFGLRLDMRGFTSQTPTFGIPKTSGAPNTITIPHGGALNSMQITGGFTVYLGPTCPPIVHTFTVPEIAMAGAATLCPGESTKLSVTPQDTIASHRATFRWSVNDKPADGSAAEYTFTAPREAGSYKISVHVEDDTSGSTDKCEIKATRKSPAQPADRTTTVQVKEYKPPTANCSAVGPTTIKKGERTTARVSATGSECSGRLTYRWTASEGRISSGADAEQAEFDSTDVRFSEEPPGQEQRKNVTLTATVTDERGGSANCAVNVTVTYTPPVPPPKEPIRLDDILFAKGSTRVNNCGQKLLRDELYPQMTANQQYDVVIIGHIDENEQPPARRGARRARPAAATQLDHERVLNVAAFLTAGPAALPGKKCLELDPSRIKVDWVGTDQTSDFRDKYCPEATQKRGERPGQAVVSSDARAKYRRVEIWLVPKGAELPKAVKAIKEAPVSEIKAKGCPK